MFSTKEFFQFPVSQRGSLIYVYVEVLGVGVLLSIPEWYG